MWFKGFHEAMWIKGNRSKRRPTKSKNNNKKNDNPSHTGNRTRATAVRAPDPNH